MNKLKFFPLLPNKDKLSNMNAINSYLKSNSNSIVNSIEEANIFLVASGDGGMTESVRNYHKYKKPFFGINYGRLGFLMNQFTNDKILPKSTKDINILTLKLMKAVFINKKKEEQSYYVFNDVFCGGSIADFMTFHIKGSLSHFQNITVKGTGVYISTPQGTTAYALNATGSQAVIPLDSDTWYIGGIATGHYPCSIFKPQKVSIKIESRTKVYGYADGSRQVVKDIEKIIVSPTNIEVKLSFLKKTDFEARRRALALAISQGNFDFDIHDL